MIKYSNIISKMELHDKLNLINSFGTIDNSSLNDELKNLNHKVNLKGVTYNDVKLLDVEHIASSFNDDLIFEYSSFLGYCANLNNEKFILGPSINPNKNGSILSSEYYFNKRFLKEYSKGLDNYNVVSLYNYFDNGTYFSFDSECSNSYARFINSLKENEVPYILYDARTNKFKSNNIFNQIIKNGYDGLFFIQSSLQSQPKRTISLSRSSNGTFNLVEEEIDEICDQLLDMLLKENEISPYNGDIVSLIHNLVYESTVELKNTTEDSKIDMKNILFITSNNSISNESFNTSSDRYNIDVSESLKNIETLKKYDTLIFEVDKNTDLKFVTNLLTNIRQENSDIQIITLITTQEQIEINFDSYCQGIYKTLPITEDTILPIMDIILGKTLAKGHLTVSYLNSVEDNSVKYGFGYSNTSRYIDCKDIKYDKNKITLIMKNNSNLENNELIQIYLKKYYNDTNKELVYYKKVYFKPNESKEIEIILTKDMFRLYSDYCSNEKELYNLDVSVSSTNILKSYKILVEDNKNISSINSDNSQSMSDNTAPDNKVKNIVVNIIYIVFLILTLILTFTSNSNISPVLLLIFIILLCFFIPRVMRYFKKNKQNVESKESKDIDLTDAILFEEYYKPSQINEKSQIIIDKTDDELLDIKQENKDEMQNFLYVKNDNDLTILKDNLFKFLLSKGIYLDDDEYNDIFSAIGSSRIIYIEYNDRLLFEKFLVSLNDFYNNQKFDCLNLYDTIVRGSSFDDNIFFTEIKEIDENINLFNLDAKYYVDKVNVKVNDKNITLSKNVIYFIDAKLLDVNNFDYDSVLIKVNFKQVNVTDFDDDIKAVYFSNLNNTLINLSDSYSLGEDVYKKFDELLEFLESKGSLIIDNKFNNHLEKYIALNLFLGNDNFKTIDKLFCNKLVNYIFKIYGNKINKEELTEKLEELFGEQYLENTYNIINEINIENSKGVIENDK